MDGLQACKRLVEQYPGVGSARTRPIIVGLTANALPADRAACFAVQMDAFLPKPTNMQALGKEMQRWAAQARAILQHRHQTL